MAEADRRARVERLLAAARLLADPGHEAGRLWRQHLLQTSGLSAAGIELGIGRCLETLVSPNELAALLLGTPEAPRAHVLLSGNVFVAALRAVAIATVASPRVSVRASRRDPALPEALERLVPGLFELVGELEPSPGDHFWAYGSDETLRDIQADLPRGVWFHGHGHGVGVVVLESAELDPAAAARAIALDTVVFDQRGCLSPRAVLVAGSAEETLEVARALAHALAELERAVPLGPRDADEQAEARRQTDAARYAFELFEAGSAWVSVGRDDVPAFPSVARCLHVVRASEPVSALLPLSRHLTCVGSSCGPLLSARLRDALRGARHVALGEMQRPPLDGPVDRRHDPQGELL